MNKSTNKSTNKMSEIISFEVNRYLDSPIYITVQRTTTLAHLYAKVRGTMFPLTQCVSSPLTRGAALHTLWGTDDIPQNTTIHDIFTFSSKFDHIQSIPREDFITIGDFMDDYPSYFETISNKAVLHSTYKIYVVDDASFQILQTSDPNKPFSSTIKLITKRVKNNLNSLLACIR